jgi:putative transport protein
MPVLDLLRPLLDTLADTPLLLLFAVVAVGYPLGRVRVRGVSLGIAAILFAGLGIGALDARLRLPEVIHLLGLCLFVYSVGLSSGPGFVSSLRRHGARNGALVALALAGSMVVTIVGSRLAGIDDMSTAGLFAGSLTNTPALAAALEMLQQVDPGATDRTLSAPVVAYSVAYPLGVLLPILAISLLPRLFRDQAPEDARTSHQWPAAGKGRAGSGSLVVGTIKVTRADADGLPIAALRREAGTHVQTGRIKRVDGTVQIATDNELLRLGDLVTAVGESDDVERLVERLGERSSEAINLDRRELDVRRIFVSNAEVAGHSLRELNLTQQFGAIITAIRRGDADWVPTGNTVLQLGDRVRVLTRREALPAVGKFLGDSYRAVSEFDVLTFSFGIVLGIAVGLVPIPLPGGFTVRLGLAGGPLVVAMLLGARGRTGPLVWGIPYSVSLTIREIGLLLFFAGIGTRSGFALWDALHQPATLSMLAVGALSTGTAAAIVLLAGRYLFQVPAGLLTGMIAGVHTQPAALSVALEQRLDDTPNVGYAAVFPVATVLKLILAQVLARG